MKLESAFRRKSVIIMDFDGTVADTSRIHEAAFRTVFRAHGIGHFSYAEFAGMPTVDVVKTVVDRAGVDLRPAELSRAVQEKQHIARNLMERLRPMPGALAFIQAAHAASFRLGLATGGSSATVRAGLQALGLEWAFDSVVTADDVDRGKPEPDAYLAVLGELRVEPRKSVAIEDAESGVMAALAAGLDVVAVGENADAISARITAVPAADFTLLTEIVGMAAPVTKPDAAAAATSPTNKPSPPWDSGGEPLSGSSQSRSAPNEY